MEQLEWTDKFSVQIARMDEQHRQIFELLNRFRNVSAGESDKLAAAALTELFDYAEFHLRREELILRVRSYPGYPEHKAEHDEYREKVSHLQEASVRINKGVRIANFLAHWWGDHIMTSDQKYAAFFRSSRIDA
jgi:hemerythrin